MPCGKKKSNGNGRGRRIVASLVFMLPLVAFASGEKRTTPISDTVVTVKQDCRHCTREALGWFLAGVGVTVLFYESQKKDKTVALMPTADGAAIRAEWRF